VDFHPEMHLVTARLDQDHESFKTWNERLRIETVSDAHRDVLARLDAYLPEGENSIFDVGAGGGGFLALAQASGFRPDGNDIARGAVEVTRRQHGIVIRHGVLSELEPVPPQDALTLWCVLAHVFEPDQLMADSLDLLRPGGVLYLQTPRWSLMDRLGLGVHWISRGRWTRVTDRRLALHHMVLHSVDSIRILLTRAGFDVIAVEPRVRFSLQIHDYLETIRFSPRWATALARPFEFVIDRNLFPRNIVDVFARRPEDGVVVSMLPRSRRRGASAVAAAALVLAGGGTAAAATQNALPAPVQRFVANATADVLPEAWAIPHPDQVPVAEPPVPAKTSPTPGPVVAEDADSVGGAEAASSGIEPNERQPGSGNGQAGKTGDVPSAEVEVPKVDLPKVEVPKVEVPKVDLPKVDLPKVEVPKVTVPEVKVPKVELPPAETPKVKVPDLKGAAKSVHELPEEALSNVRH